MAFLLGDSAIEATAKVFKKEQGAAYKVGKPAVAATLEVLEWYFGGSTGTQAVDFGIYEDEAGKPGKLLAHKSKSVIAAEKESWIQIAGFTLKLEPAKEYWLAILNPTAGVEPKYRYKKEAGHEAVFTTALAGLELKEGNTWTALPESAAMSFWAVGTEEAGGARDAIVMML